MNFRRKIMKGACSIGGAAPQCSGPFGDGDSDDDVIGGADGGPMSLSRLPRSNAFVSGLFR
jgi:hypothetical protein